MKKMIDRRNFLKSSGFFALAAAGLLPMHWVIANEERLTGEASEALANSIVNSGFIKTITQHPDLIHGLYNEKPEQATSILVDLLLLYIPHDTDKTTLDELKNLAISHSRQTDTSKHDTFENWAKTIINKPSQTHFPKAIIDAMAIVKNARQMGKRVRIANFRHSWSSVFSDNNEILIALQSEQTALGKPSIVPPMDPDNEFQGINLVGNEYFSENTKHHLCKIGSATANDHLRRWSKALWEQKKEDTSIAAWNIPYNVILVENSLGGVLSSMCHGAGIKHKSLTDLVMGIEYIDASGNLATVYDPDIFARARVTPAAGIQIPDAQLLHLVAGHFGLIGIVTNLYIQLDEMTFARFQPDKSERLALSVPPTSLNDIPPQVDISGISKSDLENAKLKFIENARNAYYCEWFFFPYQHFTWTNIWKNDGDIYQSELYPTETEAITEEVFEYITYLITPVLRDILNQQQIAHFFGDLAFKRSFSPGNPIITPVSEAIHFQRGIHNLPVYDMEVEVPIPVLSDEVEWDVVFQAWWKAITVFYCYTGNKQPIQTAIEMRICGGSDIALAPYKGNFATCSIEILSLQQSVSLKDWTECMQMFVNELATITDSSGAPLNIRPHWSKQWDGVSIRNMDSRQYLKHVYRENIREFKTGMQQIAAYSGITITDMQQRFGNMTFDQIIFD